LPPIGTGALRWRLFDLGKVEAESRSRAAGEKLLVRKIGPFEN
jgi:hypothetical protein